MSEPERLDCLSEIEPGSAQPDTPDFDPGDGGRVARGPGAARQSRGHATSLYSTGE